MTVSQAELAAPLAKLFSGLPMPTGIKAKDAFAAYCDALNGFSLDEVEAGISRFLRGECDELKKSFVPRPPELATIVRQCAGDLDDKRKLATPKPKHFTYRPPDSPILEPGCTKAWAMQLIANGVYPRGSIWCPGSLDNPSHGDLYGPDPDWKGAKPYEPTAAETSEERPLLPDLETRHRMTQSWLTARKMFEPERTKKAKPVPKKTDAEILAELEARANEPIGATPALLKTLGFTEPETLPMFGEEAKG